MTKKIIFSILLPLMMVNTASWGGDLKRTDTYWQGGKEVAIHVAWEKEALIHRPGVEKGVPVYFLEGASAPSQATGDATAWITEDFVLGLKSGHVVKELGNLIPVGVLRSAHRLGKGIEIYRLKANSPAQSLALSNLLGAMKKIVDFAHPDFILPFGKRSAELREGTNPNPLEAPLFHLQWNLENNGQNGGKPHADIGVLDAWQKTTGSAKIVVADIDLGFEQDHPAMVGGWYVNSKEIAANKRDDDNNGYIDDVSGWNFSIEGTNLIYGSSNSHGTATAGIIGARSGGKGSVGICSGCTILPLVVDDRVSTQAAAFYYAQAAGAQVISNSWGYALNAPRTDVVVKAIGDVAKGGRGGKGTSIVFAMSNYNKDDCRVSNPDISSLADVIAVSAVDFRDEKVKDSAFGPCLQFVAPSSIDQKAAIVTTDRQGEKGYNKAGVATDLDDRDFTNSFFGTSAAAPQVSGVLGLLYSLCPSASAAQILTALQQGADKIGESSGYDSKGHSNIFGYGRVNAGRAAEKLPCL